MLANPRRDHNPCGGGSRQATAFPTGLRFPDFSTLARVMKRLSWLIKSGMRACLDEAVWGRVQSLLHQARGRQ